MDDAVELKSEGKEQACDYRLLPSYMGSTTEDMDWLEFFSPTMLDNLKDEDLESFAIDDLIQFIQWNCCTLENKSLTERTLELLPPGEKWNRNTWEHVATVLDELVYSLGYSRGTTSLVGTDKLEDTASGEEIDDIWEKVFKCKICSRLISIEHFETHLSVFHSNSVQYFDEIQCVDDLDDSLDKECANENVNELHRNNCQNGYSPLSPFFYGDDKDITYLRQRDRERWRHLESRVVQCPRVFRKRRRALSEETPSLSLKSKLQKKSSSNNDVLNTKKENHGQEGEDEWLAPVMFTCATYLASMHDLNQVKQNSSFLKDLPNHIDISHERVQNERYLLNTLHLLTKKRNLEGNINECLERQRHIREAIYSHRKERRNNSFLTDSASLLVSKGDPELAVASASFPSKMANMRMDNTSPDLVSTLRNGNLGLNNTYFPRANSTAPPKLQRLSQENRTSPAIQANMLVDAKYSGMTPTGKPQLENNSLMEGDTRNEVQSYSYPSMLPPSNLPQSSFGICSVRPLEDSKSVSDKVPNHHLVMTGPFSEQQQNNIQSSSFGVPRLNIPSQSVNSPLVKNNDSGASKGKRKSTKSVKRERSGGEQTLSYRNLTEQQQRETLYKWKSEVIPKETLDGKDWTGNASNTFRPEPNSTRMFNSKSPRILSHTGMSVPRNTTTLENMGQRQSQVVPSKQWNDFVGLMERKRSNTIPEQFRNERGNISTPHYTASFMGEESGTKNYQENVSSYSSSDVWKQNDRRKISKYTTGLESLTDEQTMKGENGLSENYNALWNDPVPVQHFQKAQMPSKLISRNVSKSSNGPYEEDYFNIPLENEGVFSPRSFGMDHIGAQCEYNVMESQSKNTEPSSMQELSESSIDLHPVKSEFTSSLEGWNASRNMRNVQSTNVYLPNDSAKFHPDSPSFTSHINKAIRNNADGEYSKEVSMPIGSRNGQVPLRNVTFGSFGVHTLSATNLQRGGNAQPRQSGQQTSEETYGILQNLRGGGSQSLSSLMTTSNSTTSSKKLNFPNQSSEKLDAKQAYRFNSTLVSSPPFDNHASSIDSRVTLSTGNLRRKEYYVRNNTHEDINFGTQSEDVSRKHR